MLESYVKFRRGLLSDFNNIAEKESDTLYFIYENESSLTADLYLGARKISSGISTGTGGASTLKELTDVLLSQEISPNSLLVYDDNGRWVNKTLNEIFSDVNLNQVIKVVKNNQKANSHQDLIDEAFATEEELPKNGDIVIIEDITSTGVIQHTTGYIYDGSHWVAMNGNYNADNIYFDNNFIFTEDIGTIVIPESGSYEAPAAGKNLTEFLASIFAQEKDPETTNPTAVISVTGGNGEVGSSYSLPKATLTVTDGLPLRTHSRRLQTL